MVRRLKPGLEALEERVVLSHVATQHVGLAEVATTNVGQVDTTAHARYLDELEMMLADGMLAPVRRDALLRALDRGMPRESVVGAFLRMPEVASGMAAQDFKQFVGQAPDAASQARLASVLRRGGDHRTVMALVIGSPQYFQARGGGTNAGFVTAMYRDTLGRSATDAEVARGAARLDHGGSRAGMARGLMLSREGSAFLVRATSRSTEHLGGRIDPAAAFRTLRAPSGQNRLLAQFYASPAFYAKAIAPPALPTEGAPTLTDDPTAHPPGLPMAPGFDLGTHWTALLTDGGPTVDGSNLLASASDGSIWATGGSGSPGQLFVYTPGAAPSSQKWTALTLTTPVTSFVKLAAVSQGEVWAIANLASGSNHLISIDASGNVTDLGELSPDNPYVELAAASDGTRVLRADDGTFRLFPPGANTPTTIAGLLGVGSSLTVGSLDEVYIIAYDFGDKAYLLWHYDNAGNTWDAADFVPGVDPQNFRVAATADGTLWAWSGQSFYQKTAANGIWQKLETIATLLTPDQTPLPDPLIPPANLAIGAPVSQYRMAAVLADNTIQVLNVGVLSQPSVPYPAIPADQQVGYDAISAKLGLPTGEGIRDQYENLNFNSNGAGSVIDSMSVPAGMDPDDWAALKQTIEHELDLLGNVKNLFGNLATMNGQLSNNSQSYLKAAYKGVQSATTDETALAELLMEGLTEALLWGVSAGGLGDAVAVTMAVAASAYGSVTPFYTNGSGGLKVAYQDMSQAMTNYFSEIVEKTDAYEEAVLGDWARLQNVSEAALGPWYLNPLDTYNISTAVEPAYSYFFYQSLMPANWQAVYYPNSVPCRYDYGNCYAPDPKSYILVTTPIPNSSNVQFRYINQRNATTNIWDEFGDGGPYPTPSLISKIEGWGVSLQTLVSAQGGWNFNVITVKD